MGGPRFWPMELGRLKRGKYSGSVGSKGLLSWVFYFQKPCAKAQGGLSKEHPPTAPRHQAFQDPVPKTNYLCSARPGGRGLHANWASFTDKEVNHVPGPEASLAVGSESCRVSGSALQVCLPWDAHCNRKPGAPAKHPGLYCLLPGVMSDWPVQMHPG